jgi:hypothetical protein
MSTFTLVNPVTGQSVQLGLTFDLNPLGTNTWQVIGGDSTVLPVSSGTWNSDGLQNVLVIRDSTQREIVRLDPIDTAVSLTDPFQNLAPGTMGSGIFAGGSVCSWTYDGP